MASTDRTAQALARLDGGRDWEVVLEHLRHRHREAVIRAVESTDLLMIGRAQGAAQALGDFLNLVDQPGNRQAR